MKVLVPLNSKDHVASYIASGAGEFYIGFYDSSWEKRFGDYHDLNRMSGYRKNANAYTFEEMCHLLVRMKEKTIPTFVTFNSSCYSDEQLDTIKEYFVRLKELGADGVIVSCAELVMLAVEIGIPAVVSTIAGVYNHDIAKFYAELGAKRIILPRDLFVSEIRSIVERLPKMEFEVFMMRNGCVFSDSYCLGLHRSEKCSVCGAISTAKEKVVTVGGHSAEEEKVLKNDCQLRSEFHNQACGQCAIYDFVSMGISAAKIVGRSDDWVNICDDIEAVARNIKIAKGCKSRKEYLSKMERKQENSLCHDSFSCYYPEIRFDS